MFSYYMISRCITSAMCMGEKVPPLDVLMVIGGGGGCCLGDGETSEGWPRFLVVSAQAKESG